MGTILHLDAFSGAAGNMFMGALLDLGLSRKALLDGLAPLGLEFRLVVKKVERRGFAARYVDVRVPEAAKARRARTRAHRHGPHGHSHTHAHGRHYAEIRRLIERAGLEPDVKKRSLAIFEALANAEAKVHGTDVEAVHFHEVGAVDAIVDVTAAAIGLARLDVERVTCSPIGIGHGTIESAHGRLPLPAPATLELLRGLPTTPAGVAWETLTPTGAAILRTVVDEFGELPAMTIEKVGYGAGNDRPGPLPNVLRAVLGRGRVFEGDRVLVLETNLDDLVPEHFDHLMERLFEAGALDVSLSHLQMKKNRPGFLLRVLARPVDRDVLARIVFAESTAIGVRISEWDRLKLEREVVRLKTKLGPARVKRIRGVDGSIQHSPEYDDCKKIAVRTGLALREVVAEVERAARDAEQGRSG
ncbi:MAG: nickel pincer cofactor biosynthesis protein LarC [Spirochaetaceae bacterium]|nr:nickel pincer cofactor biosynthesis protein LarC [Myxococcales bacterium]MCB9725817.1 nickel pincer cofactor biosynthesis protein LarC [Spirochaetaceae bacterium]HPG26050.1 nickel pincer cofactor biosynthesis protein LarC [Myxococcota bacterium]